MKHNVANFTIIRSQKALDRWERKNCISYSAKPKEFPCLVRSLISSDENGFTDVTYLADVVAAAKALVHEQDMAALKATKPELFAQIKNIIFKGADPDCKQCKGTGRYQMPPAFPRFRAADSWADCPCVTTVGKSTKGNVEVTTIDTGSKMMMPDPEFVRLGKLKAAALPVCIEDRAIHILRARGELRAGDLGWELWGETSKSSKRGTGSHRANKFCRPAGKLLKALEKAGRVTKRSRDNGFYWRSV